MGRKDVNGLSCAGLLSNPMVVSTACPVNSDVIRLRGTKEHSSHRTNWPNTDRNIFDFLDLINLMKQKFLWGIFFSTFSCRYGNFTVIFFFGHNYSINTSSYKLATSFFSSTSFIDVKRYLTILASGKKDREQSTHITSGRVSLAIRVKQIV
jgi:hypothetical protein